MASEKEITLTSPAPFFEFVSGHHDFFLLLFLHLGYLKNVVIFSRLQKHKKPAHIERQLILGSNRKFIRILQMCMLGKKVKDANRPLKSIAYITVSCM